MFLRNLPDIGIFEDDLSVYGNCRVRMPPNPHKPMMHSNAVIEHELPAHYEHAQVRFSPRIVKALKLIKTNPPRLRGKTGAVVIDGYELATGEEIPAVRKGLYETARRITSFKPAADANPHKETDWLHAL